MENFKKTDKKKII